MINRILQILVELREERDRLDEAILTIERLAAGSNIKRRGRPPKWLANLKTNGVKGKSAARTNSGKKYKRSAKARKNMADGQKRRWAAVHARRHEVQGHGSAHAAERPGRRGSRRVALRKKQAQAGS